MLWFASCNFLNFTCLARLHLVCELKRILPNSYVEAVIPNVKVFGDGASGRRLGLDEVIGVGPWSYKTSGLIRRDIREISLSAYTQRGHVSTQPDGDHLKARRRRIKRKHTLLIGTLILNFPASKTVIKCVCCCWSCTFYSVCYGSQSRLIHPVIPHPGIQLLLQHSPVSIIPQISHSGFSAFPLVSLQTFTHMSE